MDEVLALMGPWRVFLYRLRHVALRATITLTLVVVVLYQKETAPAVASALTFARNFLLAVSPRIQMVFVKALSMLSIVGKRLSAKFM